MNHIQEFASKKRTYQAQKYYFGIVVEYFRFGLFKYGRKHTPEEVHHILKQVFNNGKSTAKMNGYRHSEYLEEIKACAAIVLNTYIPDPNEIID